MQKTSKNEIEILPATLADISDMVLLSYQKRKAYEKAQPQFWRHADDAEESQLEWFKTLLRKDDTIILVAKLDKMVVGFVIGQMKSAPEVYDPGGFTLAIDDFCVKSSDDWKTVGSKLLAELKKRSQLKGARQMVVVSGAQDEPKRQFLQSISLTVASEWYVGKIQ